MARNLSRSKRQRAKKRAVSRRAPKLRLAGVELYFSNLEKAERFYKRTLGLDLSGKTPGHHAQFNTGTSFLCLERKGAENYPSRDKAVVFLEVPDVGAFVTRTGRSQFVHIETGRTGVHWAVMQDPEGHNVLFLEPPREAGVNRRKRARAAKPKTS